MVSAWRFRARTQTYLFEDEGKWFVEAKNYAV